MPGAPTVYYGDEVGLTGDDDPDDRRTYPWSDLGGTPDAALQSHYTQLASVRKANPALTSGDFRVLLADDASGRRRLRPEDGQPGRGRDRQSRQRSEQWRQSRWPATSRTASR